MIQRRLWSTRYLYYYHTPDFLEDAPAERKDYPIVFEPLANIYPKYYSQLSELFNKFTLEYLRIKFNRADPYMFLMLSNDIVVHCTFFAKPSSYSEYQIIDHDTYVVGPGFTKAEFRGKGMLPSAMMTFRASPMGRHGLSGFMLVDNASSYRALEKAGLKRIFRFRHDVRFGFNFFHIEERYSQRL